MSYELLIEKFNQGRNIFLSGGAGTGKSYNINKLIEYCDDNNINVARAAMTGMASLQLPMGETVHSLFKLGSNTCKEQLSNVVTHFMFERETRYILQVLDAIIIDEISMMRSDLLELIDAVLKYTMENGKPFGGKQVIFLGDFMQLPPVVKDEEPQEIKNRFWAFESPVWAELNFDIIYLTEIKRQDNQEFSGALNMIRAGYVNDWVSQYFFRTQMHNFPKDVTPVKLCSTNFEAEKINMTKLISLHGEFEIYNAIVDADNDFLRKKIIKDVTALENLKLKVGCQVMILKNEKGVYVNGSMGEYLGRISYPDESDLKGEKMIQALRVKLFDTGRIVNVELNEWTIEKTKNGVRFIEAKFIQFPVKPAYAITIHKSQGMSIDYLEVNLKKCFADHMAYVALSRARTYEGLRIINWNPNVVKIDKKAFGFYMNLKERGVI